MYYIKCTIKPLKLNSKQGEKTSWTGGWGYEAAWQELALAKFSNINLYSYEKIVTIIHFDRKSNILTIF